MAYTASAVKISSNFASMRNDANRVPIQAGSAMQIIDATPGTPVLSPVTVVTTQTLTVPEKAVGITIVSVANGVQVSDDSTQLGYFTLPAGIPWTFDCANQKEIYLKTSTSTVVNFYFNII